jgi:hypothetical protein
MSLLCILAILNLFPATVEGRPWLSRNPGTLLLWCSESDILAHAPGLDQISGRRDPHVASFLLQRLRPPVLQPSRFDRPYSGFPSLQCFHPNIRLDQIRSQEVISFAQVQQDIR